MILVSLMVAVCISKTDCPPKQAMGEPWQGTSAMVDCEAERQRVTAIVAHKAPKAVVRFECRPYTSKSQN